MTHLFRSVAAAAMLLSLAAGIGRAQQPTSAPAASTVPTPPIPTVGEMAPDFVIHGAMRYGLLKDPSRLSDFRGQTVVLWFFIRARTRG